MEVRLEEILCAAREWAGHVPFPAEILRDDGVALRIIWETSEHLAELIVRETEYAPHRCVSFLLLDVSQEPDQEPLYSYHDREDSTVEEILTALDRGAAMMTERRERYV